MLGAYKLISIDLLNVSHKNSIKKESKYTKLNQMLAFVNIARE